MKKPAFALVLALSVLAALGLAVVGAAPTRADDETIPAESHFWLRFAVGSRCELAMSTKMGEEDERSSLTTELLAKDEKGFTVRNTKSSEGEPDEVEEEWESIPRKAGAETLTIAGAEHAATIWVSETRKAGTTGKNRLWTIEGRSTPVKLEAKVPDSDLVATATSLSEKVTIDGTEYDCVKLEGQLVVAGGALKLKIAIWLCAELPGGVARMTATGDLGDEQTLDQSVEATKIETK